MNRAIDDYTKVIKLAPGHTDARFSRGFLAFYEGRMDLASSDFTAVYKSASGDLRDYALIWRYLSNIRNGADMLEALKSFDGLDNRTSWPGILVAMFSGASAPAGVLAAARDPNPKKQSEKECIAYFFLGQQQLIQGNRDQAENYFMKTVATGVTNYRQYVAAEIELKRLQR